MSCAGLAGFELQACRVAAAFERLTTTRPLAGVADLVEAAGWLALGLAALVLAWRVAPRLARALEREDWRSVSFGFGGAQVSATRGAEKTAQLVSDLQSKVIDLATAQEGRAEPAGDGFAPPGPPADAETDLPRLAVLWVDGTPANIAFERSILESLGHSVHVVSTTDAARTRLRDGPTVDVVVSDLDRSPEEPALAGLELHRWIREAGLRGGGRPVPFALYTRPEAVRLHAQALAGDPEAFATASFAALRSRLRWLQYALHRGRG